MSCRERMGSCCRCFDHTWYNFRCGLFVGRHRFLQQAGAWNKAYSSAVIQSISRLQPVQKHSSINSTAANITVNGPNKNQNKPVRQTKLPVLLPVLRYCCCTYRSVHIVYAYMRTYQYLANHTDTTAVRIFPVLYSLVNFFRSILVRNP